MKVATAIGVVDEIGPLTRIIYDYVAAQVAVITSGVSSPSDWNVLAKFVDIAAFKRVGAYLEELDWEAYKKFLTGWAAGGTRFEMTEFHISEIGNTVFQEIEERHWRGEEFIRKNIIAVYRFNVDRKIVHQDIYEQAKDSGQWIAEAASAATVPG